MLSFFPIPYKDEILYSVFARYHIRSGNTSFKSTINDLFGSTNITAVMDLPSNLNKLIENLPVGSKYTAEYLIYNHTLYPFYALFGSWPCKRSFRFHEDGQKAAAYILGLASWQVLLH